MRLLRLHAGADHRNRYLVAAVCAPAVAQPPAPAPVTLTAADGAKLKATYFSPRGNPAGIVLLHQCNRDRRVVGGLRCTGCGARLSRHRHGLPQVR